MKKVFLDDLPRKKGKGKSVGLQVMDWNNCVGYIIKFIYDDIEGEVKIVNYDGKKVWIKYLNKNICKICTDSFKKCLLGKVIGKRTSDFKIEIGQLLKTARNKLII